MGFSIKNALHKLQSVATQVEKKVEHTVAEGAKAVVQKAKDGFSTVERQGVVLGDAAARAIQNVTHPATIGTPNPKAGVGRPPVVLLAGQGDHATQAMKTYARSLERDGFKVFIFDDPGHAMESHGDASKQLDSLVEKIRKDTGAAKVDLVGYSTGGTNARAYVNLYGGADKVGRVVQLAGTNNGDPGAFGFMASGREERAGSKFIQQLNAQQANVPVYSIYEKGTDGAVQEDDAKLKADGLRHNVELPQRQKGGGFIAWSDHVNLPYDARAYEATVAALTNDG